MPPRKLHPGEAKLWRDMTRDVARRQPETVLPDDLPAMAQPPAAIAPLPSPPVKSVPAVVGMFDSEVERRLLSGKARPDARLDLHGLTESEAHAALDTFIAGCVHSKRRLALVITGKGRFGNGVLRQNLPRWLEAPQWRACVAGSRPAFDRHGGEGAFYILFRRRPR